MSQVLQIEIEFSEHGNNSGLTTHALSHTVETLLLNAGLAREVVVAGIQEVNIDRSYPLVDPGSAAIVVALIGLSGALIKQYFDERARNKELALKEREVDLKEQELQLKFVSEVLLPTLREQYGIEPLGVILEQKDQG